MTRGRSLDIAIIGMALRASGKDGLPLFWNGLLDAASVPEGSTSRALENVLSSAIAEAGFKAGFPPSSRVRLIISSSEMHAGPSILGLASSCMILTGPARIEAVEIATRSLAQHDTDVVIVADAIGAVVLQRHRDALNDDRTILATLKCMTLSRSPRRASKALSSAILTAHRLADVMPESVAITAGEGWPKTMRKRTSHRPNRISTPFYGLYPIANLVLAASTLHYRAIPPLSDRRGKMRPIRPWIHGDESTPRRAAVASLGEDRTASYILLEEELGSDLRPGAGLPLAWETEAFLIASDDGASLVQALKRIQSRIEKDSDTSIADLAFSIASEFSKGPSRLGIVAGSTAELREKIAQALKRLRDPACRSIRDARGTYFRENAAPSGGLAVMFPGEGSQYPGMLADLSLHFPEVRARMDVADRVARRAGSEVLPSELLYGENAASGDLWGIGTAVNVVLSTQWALYGLFLRLGITPDAVVGHSSGEWLSLAAAGAVEVDRAFEEALGGLGSVFETMGSSGDLPESKLIAASAPRERVETVLAGLPVLTAIDNCPHQVVIACPNADADDVEARLKAESILYEILPFERAYHTPEFASVVAPIRELLQTRIKTVPSLPIYSCASADRMPAGRDSVLRLAEAQWSEPVRFRETIERMYNDGYRVFVDIGARGHLAGFVEDTLRGKDAHALAANIPRRAGTTQWNHLICNLFTLGYPVSTDFLMSRRRPGRLDLDPPGSQPAPEDNRVEAVAPLEVPEIEQVPTMEFPVEPDEVMLDYLRTMDDFLATQRDVMAAYLSASTAESSPHEIGPWAGEIVEHEPRRSVLTLYRLDAKGDPVAANHTLGGRRVSKVDPSRLGLAVLPFTVMAEMMAQTAAILAPDQKLVAMEDVIAHRWIRYKEAPVGLEIEAHVIGDDQTRFAVKIFNRGPFDALRPREAPVVEGVMRFAEARPAQIAAAPFKLDRPTRSKFTSENVYGEQWLFHGPALQAVSEVGEISDGGIVGKLRVLPRGGLFRLPEDAAFLRTDPIILDNFTHLLGAWGLDRLGEGDVIFPLKMGELQIFGDDPPEGDEVDCRIRITKIERHRISVEAEIVREDGSIWMGISRWEDWRFYWPSKYRDVFRRPDIEMLGDLLPVSGPALAVWLQPPADMGKPVWRDVLEQIALSDRERSLLAVGPEPRRSLRLWGRMAAKEAARRIAMGLGHPASFPFDWEILPDGNGKPVVTPPSTARLAEFSVSIAHSSGVAVALATVDPSLRPGIDVEPIVSRSAGFEAMAFLPGERKLLDLAARSRDRDEWVARFWCAKEAAAKSTGLGMIDGPGSVEIAGLGPGEGDLLALVRGENFAIRVVTGRREGYVWAWTLGERGLES